MLKIKYKKIHPEAKEPFKKHIGDAGYDLFAVEDKVIPANITTDIPTGIILKMPEGYYVEIHTRSSHGKLGMKAHLGVVDEGYHGEITVLMTSPTEYKITKGDKVAQLIFRKRISTKFIEAEEGEEFISDRGTGGFGSTGK
jgi:dUTP pyrophosphatase